MPATTGDVGIVRALRAAPGRMARRGVCFWVNVALCCFLVWLLAVLADYQSMQPSVGPYSAKYAVMLLSLALVTVMFGVATFFGTRELNQRLLVAAAASVATLEVMVRLFMPGVPYRQDVYRAPAPYAMFTGLPNGSEAAVDNYRQMGGQLAEAKLELNELGFRGPSPPPVKKDEYRVIVLGGSLVFNGIPLGRSIAGELERRYHAEGRTDVRVYNWGVVAAVSGQELVLLATRAVDYRPDLVVVVDGLNDVGEPFWHDPRPGYPYNFMSYEWGVLYLAGRVSLKEAMVVFLNGRSALARLALRGHVYQLLGHERLRHEAGYLGEAWVHRLVDGYLKNIDKMCVIGAAYESDVAVFLQPVVLSKTPKVGREASLAGPGPFQSHVASAYGGIRKGLVERQRVAARGCLFADLGDVFTGVERELYWDFAHVVNDGNRTLAGRIYADVSAFYRR